MAILRRCFALQQNTIDGIELYLPTSVTDILEEYRDVKTHFFIYKIKRGNELSKTLSDNSCNLAVIHDDSVVQ